MDAFAVSRAKRSGWDGTPVRDLENAVLYVLANSVGPRLLAQCRHRLDVSSFRVFD